MSNENIKPFFNPKREVLGKILPIDTPFTVIIDTSEICNFKCNYCFRGTLDRESEIYARTEGLMKWDVFVKIVEQIKQFPNQVKRISLSGHGEPLCNSLLADMVRYIKKNGLLGKTEIHTNGSLLNDELIENLLDSGIDAINISLQGLNSKTYKDVADVHIDFEQFYRNIEKLYKAKRHTQINIKVANISLEEGEEEIFYEKFAKISDRVYIEQIVPLFNGVDYSNIKEKSNINKYGEYFGEIKSCIQVFYNLLITPQGNIYPCAHLTPPISLGSIQERTLLEAWNSNERIEFLKKNLIKGCISEVNCRECYVKYNSIKVKEDLIDSYSEEILDRLKNIY